MSIFEVIVSTIISNAPALVGDIKAALTKQGYTNEQIDAVFAQIVAPGDLGINPDHPNADDAPPTPPAPVTPPPPPAPTAPTPPPAPTAAPTPTPAPPTAAVQPPHIFAR